MGQAQDLARDWWTSFDAGDIGGAMQLCAQDVEMTMPGGLRMHGTAHISAALTAYLEGFPDLRHEILTTVDDGERVAFELKVTATHTGAFHTPEGDIPPTGRSIVWESVDIVTARDGKIASWHAYFDQLAFLSQLGLVPEAATA